MPTLPVKDTQDQNLGLPPPGWMATEGEKIARHKELKSERTMETVC